MLVPALDEDDAPGYREACDDLDVTWLLHTPDPAEPGATREGPPA